MPVEGHPTDDQKDRLEDFLSELSHISRKYKILLADWSGDVAFIDAATDHIIGIGVATFRHTTKPTTYLPVDSILDGVWPVDTPDGPVDQRTTGNVFPMRDS